MKKIKIIISFALVIGLVYVISIKPHKVKCSYQPYFAQLNATLKGQRAGASAGIIDLDRLDNNIAVVSKSLGAHFRLRLVAKSLPSLELLKYLMEKGNTNRLMVFSEPFIAEILDSLNADSLDILLGKPLPVEALPRLFEHNDRIPITWLIDTKERLMEYLNYAKTDMIPLCISLEIDVGLHRGGFENTKQLAEVIKIIKANSQFLQLRGLMGYDGHVPFVPFYINKEKTVKKAFVNVQQSYSRFVEELKKHYDAKFISTLTFNGGGSRTYFYYPEFKDVTPVNDIAVGSGFLAPAQFPELLALGHQPALFLSSPVLKKIETAILPHAEMLSPLVNRWDPNLKVSYYMLGGGFPGDEIAPEGLKRNPFWDENDKGYSNLLPNQSIMSSSDENNLNVGDFVFYHAWEGDGMLCFKNIVLVRQNKIVGEWETYKGGN